MKSNLSIVDGDFLLWYATMGDKVFNLDTGELLKEEGKFVYSQRSLEGVCRAADDIISNILDKSTADYYIGYLGGCRSFRYNYYPEYKANRKRDDLPNWIEEVRTYLIKEYNFVETSDGLEADDAVNIVRNNLQNDYNCIIVSNDKDLIKSIKGKYLNPRNLEIIETSEEDAKKFFWTSMITGDTTDNIKGEFYALTYLIR